MSYRDLARRLDRRAGWLRRRGVGPGDRVAFCGLNRIEFIEVLAACARIGAVLLPLNNRLSVGELRYQLADAGPVLVLATDGFAPILAEAGGPAREVIDLDAGAPSADEDGGDTDQRPASPPGDATDRPLLMVYTSGTTGRPKGAVHTGNSVLFTVLNGLAQQDLTAADRILTVLPLFHVGGLNIQTLPALHVGATVILQRRFDPGQVIESIARHRPTQTLFVPAVMAAVLDHPDLDRADLSSLVGINSGSSVVPEHLIRGFLDRGIPVGQVYGATETGPTAVVLRYEDGAANVGSCGRPAMHTELRLVDGDGAEVGPDRPGEVLVRGPTSSITTTGARTTPRRRSSTAGTEPVTSAAGTPRLAVHRGPARRRRDLGW